MFIIFSTDQRAIVQNKSLPIKHMDCLYITFVYQTANAVSW